MKIENQVCTALQGKELAELGITECPTFYWSHKGYLNGAAQYELKYRQYTKSVGTVDVKHYPAFTVSELQIMSGSLGNVDISISTAHKGKFYSDIDSTQTNYDLRFEYYNTLAEAFAAKLIRGLKAEYYTADECNNRLASG